MWTEHFPLVDLQWKEEVPVVLLISELRPKLRGLPSVRPLFVLWEKVLQNLVIVPLFFYFLVNTLVFVNLRQSIGLSEIRFKDLIAMTI